MAKNLIKSEIHFEPLLQLIKEIRDLVQQARQTASYNINTLQIVTNFEIGRRIVEFEQRGNKRAEYGGQIIVNTQRN